MRRSMIVEMTPSPIELAEELWKFDAKQQADFLRHFLLNTGEYCDMLMQFEYVTDEINNYNHEDRQLIKRQLEELLDRLN